MSLTADRIRVMNRAYDKDKPPFLAKNSFRAVEVRKSLYFWVKSLS
jgi:hypothetical protein